MGDGMKDQPRQSEGRRGAVPTTLDLTVVTTKKKSVHAASYGFRKELFHLARRRLFEGIQTATGLYSDFSEEFELLSTFHHDKDKNANTEMGQTVALLTTILRYQSRADELFTKIILPMLRNTTFQENHAMLRTYPLSRLCHASFLCNLLALFLRRYTPSSSSSSREEELSETWTDRSETVHATLHEMLKHEAAQLLFTVCSGAEEESPLTTLKLRLDDLMMADNNQSGSIISTNLQSAWQATGHIHELETLAFLYEDQVQNELFEPNKMTEAMFRETCYEVLISMDQWCPVHPSQLQKMTMDASLRDWYQALSTRQTFQSFHEKNKDEMVDHSGRCSSTAISDYSSTLYSEEGMTPIPNGAQDALSGTSSILPRQQVQSRVVRRLLPSTEGQVAAERKKSDDSISSLDTLSTFLDDYHHSKNPSSHGQGHHIEWGGQAKEHLVAIVPGGLCSNYKAQEGKEGLGGNGATTIAALIAHRQDIRKHYKDGVVWLSFPKHQYGAATKRQHLSYARYKYMLGELLNQIQATGRNSGCGSTAEDNGWPEFPEMIPSLDESHPNRTSDLVEDGFKAHCFDLVEAFLCKKRVLLILDNVDNETLRWFRFCPNQRFQGPSFPSRQEFSLLVTSRNPTLVAPADTVELEALSPVEAIQMLSAMTVFDEQSACVEDARRAIRMLGHLKPILLSPVRRLVENKCRSQGLEERMSFIAKTVASLERRLNESCESCLTSGLVLRHCIDDQVGTQSRPIRICLSAFGTVFCSQDAKSDPLVPSSTPYCNPSSSDAPEVPVSVVDCLFHCVLRQLGATLSPASVRLHLINLGFLQKLKLNTRRHDVEGSDGWCVRLAHAIHKDFASSELEDLEGKELARIWNGEFADDLLRTLFMSPMDESVATGSFDDSTKDVVWGWTAPRDRFPMLSYALQSLPGHMIRGGLYQKAIQILHTRSFLHERVFHFGVEFATSSLISDMSQLQTELGAGPWNQKETVLKTWKLLGGYLADLMKEQSTTRELQDEKKVEVGSFANDEVANTESRELGRAFLKLGASLCDMGYWNEAIPFWESSRDAYILSVGEHTETTAALSHALGILHLKVQMHEDAIHFFTGCLSTRRQLYGNHSLCAKTLTSLSDTFVLIGELSDAQKGYEMAMGMLRHKPRLHRDQIGDIQERMGDLYLKLSSWELALKCYEFALLYKQAEYGEDSTELATVHQHMGMCLMHLEDDSSLTEHHLDQAIALFEEMRLSDGQEDDEEWNRARLFATRGIKLCCSKECGPQECISLFDRAHDTMQERIRRLSASNESTPVAEKMFLAFVLREIGSIHQKSSNHALALKFFQQSLNAYRCDDDDDDDHDELSDEMPCSRMEVARTMFSMATSLVGLERKEEALKILDIVLETRLRYTPGTAQVAETHETIARVAREERNLMKAQASLKEALEIRKQLYNFDESHASVAAVIKELGDLIEEIW
ncbi:Kinesin light chain [Seminavis robusta]|uniref:Kinesin light chain n=1 Tax=Seminavis robusta TaxID=568900 RepID=A0A9N8HED2_9STRA|nr:Kinesin light chain [Seminavis robusta]|eukprot:Sro466_g148860.1 Kinesin light chain (1456) ;mRNA; r:45611-49978